MAWDSKSSHTLYPLRPCHPPSSQHASYQMWTAAEYQSVQWLPCGAAPRQTSPGKPRPPAPQVEPEMTTLRNCGAERRWSPAGTGYLATTLMTVDGGTLEERTRILSALWWLNIHMKNFIYTMLIHNKSYFRITCGPMKCAPVYFVWAIPGMVMWFNWFISSSFNLLVIFSWCS